MVPLAYTSRRERSERKRSVANHENCEVLFVDQGYVGFGFFEIRLVFPAATSPWPLDYCRASKADAVEAKAGNFVGTGNAGILANMGSVAMGQEFEDAPLRSSARLVRRLGANCRYNVRAPVSAGQIPAGCSLITAPARSHPRARK